MSVGAKESTVGTIRWDDLDNGVVLLTLDDPTQRANTMNAGFLASMSATLDRLAANKADIRGVVITSGKSTFFAGADLKDLIAMTSASQVYGFVEQSKGFYRRLETLGIPVVSAIAGAALGGGFELVLATHHRIAVDSPKVILGLPEVTLGLLPGAGGVVRTVRMMGLANALTSVLLQGQRLRPAQALELGLVDELVATPDDLLPAALAWLATEPDAIQPWDHKKFRIPGGTPATPALAAMLPAFPATLRKQLKGAPYPAPAAILAAAVEGTQVDIDTALRIESRYFTSLAVGQTAKNLTQAMFFDMQHIKSGGSRPAAPPKWKATKAAVVGAGMMGAGIAYSLARNGVTVVLKDVSMEAAERGKSYSTKLLDKAVARGRSTQAQRDEVLARIHPTIDFAELAGCDLVIEAVFEDPSLKREVFGQIQKVVGPEALLASNTSTLPITGLSAAIERPEDFIGLHFFSPVDKMQLVEIVVGDKSSEETLARAYDVVQQIGKVPIVVNDSRGFFTSRVIGTLVHEGLSMLAEGIDPMLLERAATQAGFPVGVLQLVDELTLTLNKKISDTTRAELTAEGRDPGAAPGDAVLARMIEEFDRRGRSTGGGFYDYPDSGGRVLWPALRESFAQSDIDVPLVDVQERLLFIMALESVRCLDEGVLRSVPDANVGSILGIGFPAWAGGALQYVDQYAGGVAGFVARADGLAAAYGERFTAPDSLRALATSGGTLAAKHA